MHTDNPRPLGDTEIRSFIRDGFVRIDDVFPQALAAACRAILWQDIGDDPCDPATWTRPVVWLGDYAQPPFAAAANTAVLRGAYDQLVGAGRWQPRGSLGTFPVRFPTTEADTGDTGWHVDASLPPLSDDPADLGDFMQWRVNWRSDGRALLMLFLFSDMAEGDAPTRIRIGSHRMVARHLRPLGCDGRAGIEASVSDGCAEVSATGPAGTVYLCHPFLVHAAQVNRGKRPRFLAQPPLLPQGPGHFDDPAIGPSPVERAIIEALAS